MQRHFSNRGEALAELNAAKMLARRKPTTQSMSTFQSARQVKSEQWFKTRGESSQRRKSVKPPKHDEQGTRLL